MELYDSAVGWNLNLCDWHRGFAPTRGLCRAIGVGPVDFVAIAYRYVFLVAHVFDRVLYLMSYFIFGNLLFCAP